MRKESLIEYAILNYLVTRPKAMDTMRGIAEWWILKEQINFAVDKIANGLNSLIAKQYVLIKHQQNQEQYFQINKERLADIKMLLQQMLNELENDSERN